MTYDQFRFVHDLLEHYRKDGCKIEFNENRYFNITIPDITGILFSIDINDNEISVYTDVFVSRSCKGRVLKEDVECYIDDNEWDRFYLHDYDNENLYSELMPKIISFTNGTKRIIEQIKILNKSIKIDEL
jgi:hypothetical protein